MTERIQPGQYKVDSESSEDERKNTSRETVYGVIRGDVANSEEFGPFGRQFGFSDSKWYAYKVKKTELIQRVDFSPTAPKEAFRKNFSEVTIAQQEFDTKSAAVDFVEDEWLSTRFM